jgi:hypothetical protein
MFAVHYYRGQVTKHYYSNVDIQMFKFTSAHISKISMNVVLKVAPTVHHFVLFHSVTCAVYRVQIINRITGLWVYVLMVYLCYYSEMCRSAVALRCRKHKIHAMIAVVMDVF